MKLLLTSNGICNRTLEYTLKTLLGKPFSRSNLVFVPTAANVEEGDKTWLVNDLENCRKLGFKQLDIVDISATEKSIWLPRLKKGDVVLFGGGNTFHLMHWLEKTALDKDLPSLLSNKIYIGISAGSMVAGKGISLSQSEKLYYSDLKGKYKNVKGMGLVGFHIRPHLNNDYFPNVRKEVLEKQAREIKEPIYALDDESAVKVVNNKIEVVGEGNYLIFNKR